jgi:hypothetical protein
MVLPNISNLKIKFRLLDLITEEYFRWVGCSILIDDERIELSISTLLSYTFFSSDLGSVWTAATILARVKVEGLMTSILISFLLMG